MTGDPRNRGQRDDLLRELEETARALLQLGLTREELAAHLLKGGNQDA